MAELVGILNITPDSFSDGGQNDSTKAAILSAEKLFEDGASIVDVGAESTRPGAEPISWQEEVNRLTGFMRHARTMNWPVSLDTYHPETVDWASKQLGSFIINDVTGFRERAMRDLAARTGNKVIISHLPQASRSVQEAHQGKLVDSIDQVVRELHDAIDQLIQAGIGRDNIIVDPGIGFGKTRDLNWQLLKFGRHMPDYAVMVGYSRKRFLGEGRMEIEANYSAGRIAVDAGAKFLRVHDVKGHAPLISS